MSRPSAKTRPARSARAMFASSVLVTEALVVLFAGLVAFGLKLAPTEAIVWGGGALMLGAIVATGLLRRGIAGYVMGSMLQVLIVATGLVVPMMFVVGAIFAVLWVVSLRIGGRIDAERIVRERAERDDAEREDAGRADAGRVDAERVDAEAQSAERVDAEAQSAETA